MARDLLAHGAGGTGRVGCDLPIFLLFPMFAMSNKRYNSRQNERIRVCTTDEPTRAATTNSWCGSGKKYKKCHLAFDERLQSMYEQGFELPDRASLKSAADIEGIKRSATINIGVLDYVAERIGPGTTTEEVDRWVHDYTVEHGGIPADLNYEGYPKSVCTSINDVVCHGIPSEDDVLREGDIVNVDCSTILDGYYSDSSRMFRIGEVSPERARLVDETKKAMEAGLAAIEPWGLLGDVGAAVNAYAKAQGFSVVREFGGHGIGFDFHEDPFVSHVSEPGTGMVLVPGLVFTIEPMVNAGEAPIDMSDPNGWTVRTADGSDTAQWEVQVAITEDGHELLSW